MSSCFTSSYHVQLQLCGLDKLRVASMLRQRHRGNGEGSVGDGLPLGKT